MVLAEDLLAAAQIYGYVGFGVAMAFLIIGLDRIDDGAHRSYAFRPLLIPGIVLLWPIVLIGWINREFVR